MRRWVAHHGRVWALVLASSTLLATVGCISGPDRAHEAEGMISEGMSKAEVRDQLGDPDTVVRGDAGTGETWIYRFEGGPHVLLVILMVVFVVLLVALLVVAGGGGSFGGGGGGGGGDDPMAQIQVKFDADGRVIEISPVQLMAPR